MRVSSEERRPVGAPGTSASHLRFVCAWNEPSPLLLLLEHKLQRWRTPSQSSCFLLMAGSGRSREATPLPNKPLRVRRRNTLGPSWQFRLHRTRADLGQCTKLVHSTYGDGISVALSGIRLRAQILSLSEMDVRYAGSGRAAEQSTLGGRNGSQNETIDRRRWDCRLERIDTTSVRRNKAPCHLLVRSSGRNCRSHRHNNFPGPSPWSPPAVGIRPRLLTRLMAGVP